MLKNSNNFSLKLPGIIAISVLITLFSACNQSETNKQKHYKSSKNPLIEINKKLVKSEGERINDFLARYGWSMQETGSGLRYLIYHTGNGKNADTGNIAILNYTLTLLNGDTIYTSEKNGKKEFLIGKGGVESGLEEGILLLKEGDKAKFIIPSHLAFGLPGDGNKIPSKATLVYDLELIQLK